MNNYLINAVISQKSIDQKLAASFTIAIAISVSAIGSLASMLFIIVCTIGLVNAVRRYATETYLTKQDYIVVIPAFSYFAINALSLLNSPFEFKDLDALLPSFLFVMFYFAVRYYRDLRMENQFELFLRAVPYGSIFILMWTIDHVYFRTERMSGGSGNAIPFAMTCAMMLSITVLNTIRLANWERLFNILAAVIFFNALVLSGTRSMYLVLVPMLFTFATYAYIQHGQHRKKFLVITIAIIGLLGTALMMNNDYNQRTHSLVEFIHEISSKGTHVLSEGVSFENSISHRLQMIQKSLCLIYERPVTGYGIDKRREVLRKENHLNEKHPWKICQNKSRGFSYSHFHNGFLTAAVDAGIFGALAAFVLWISPLVFVLKTKKTTEAPTKLIYSLSLVLIYGFAGLTNILFGHDIIDSLFLFCCLYLLVSPLDYNISPSPGRERLK